MDKAIGDVLERGMVARREKRADNARAAFAEATALARKSGNSAALAKALANQAQIERDTHLFEQALAYQLEALSIQRVLGNPETLAHIIRHVGDILADAGRHDEADAYFAEMLALYRAMPNVPPLDLANAIRSMAVHSERMGKIDDARGYWRDARDRYAELDAFFRSVAGNNPGVDEAERRLAALRT